VKMLASYVEDLFNISELVVIADCCGYCTVVMDCSLYVLNF